jgi:hypothetical protein
MASAVCYDMTSPMHPELLTPVPCWQDSHMGSASRDKTSGGDGHPDHDHDGDGPGHGYPSAAPSSYNYKSSAITANLPFFDFAPQSPLPYILTSPALSPPTWNSTSMISFNVDCPVSPDTCYAVQKTLDLAGWYVSQVHFFPRLLISGHLLPGTSASQRVPDRFLQCVWCVQLEFRDGCYSWRRSPRTNIPFDRRGWCGAILPPSRRPTNVFPTRHRPSMWT